MRILATRLIVVGIIWMMTPGLTEAAENLWHVARAGHTAHSPDAGSDHAPQGDEHGCSSTFHLCSCHHSSCTSLPRAIASHKLHVTNGDRQLISLRCQSPDLPSLFRPPKA